MPDDPLNPFDDVDEKVQGPFAEDKMTVWYDRNGRPHRLDGPAIEYNDGRKVWALHGDVVSPDQVAAYRQQLEAERVRRREEEEARQVDAEASQFHAGLDNKTTVKPPLTFKKTKPPES